MPAATIRWLASLYGDPAAQGDVGLGGRASTRTSGGPGPTTPSTTSICWSGRWRRPGTAPSAPPGQPSGGAAAHDAGTLTETLPRGWSSRTKRTASGPRRIWGVPVDRIDPRPGAPGAGRCSGALERGDIRFLWIQATNPMVSLPNLDRYRRAAASGRTGSSSSRRRIPRRRRTWRTWSCPRRCGSSARGSMPTWSGGCSTSSGSWPPAGRRHQRRLADDRSRTPARTSRSSSPGSPDHHAEQIWDEYRRFHADAPSALPPIAELRRTAGRPVAVPGGRETRWRYSTAHDPAAERARGDFDFYGHADHRAWIWLRPTEPPAESPDRGLSVLARDRRRCWSTGARARMTQRIPSLHRALPHATSRSTGRTQRPSASQPGARSAW